MSPRDVRTAASGFGRTFLRWTERGLVAIGAALAVWCAVLLGEAHYYAALPIPPPPPAGVHPRATLEPGSWVARLEAPSVGLSATVLEGSDDVVLRRAAGHIENTAFPGEDGNVGIAGHRDTTFRPVRKLRAGDTLLLTTADGIYRYRISETTIVDPDDVYVLDPVDHPTLTLVTCYPFEFIGHAPRRFVLHADLVKEDARAALPPPSAIDRVAVGGEAPGLIQRPDVRPQRPDRKRPSVAGLRPQSTDPHWHRFASALGRAVASGPRRLARVLAGHRF